MLKFYYGTDEQKIDITDVVKKDCIYLDGYLIPKGDKERATIFTDPTPYQLKSIFIEKPDQTVFKFSFNVNIIIDKNDEISENLYINSAIVCIAKFESDYIVEFVNYHLLLGFNKIYIYDNEDTPIYQNLIKDSRVVIKHLPGKNYWKAVQYIALDHFITNYISKHTHVTHIDIDEFIVLKKHKCINEFISDQIDCAGIAMNWRHFGSNDQKDNKTISNIIRFTKCELNGNNHIKTLFDTNYFTGWDSPHSITTKDKSVKNTKGDLVSGPFNDNIDYSLIQLNHYKCKTLPEFQYIRTRGRADLQEDPVEDFITAFDKYNINEIEDYSALIFYSQNITNFLNNLNSGEIEGYCEQVPQQLDDLVKIVKNSLTILEIGFNAGHSSNLFLKNSNSTVVSFDINDHTYTKYAKIYIDHIYPDRHTLVIGDSTKTIPEYPDSKFDIIFIDGGHTYDIAKQDLENCKRFAHSDTIVIMDDTIYNRHWVQEWNIGPTKAWIESDLIIPIGKIDYYHGRGMSWGKYKLN